MTKQAAARVEAEARAGEEPSAKRSAILAAATRVFIESGYGSASMDAIARAAGVSKQTIYSHFGAKQTLFAAITQGKCEHLLKPMFLPEVLDADPERLLAEIAERFLDLVFVPGNMEFFRVVVAECRRFPELAEVFYRSGPERAAGHLARYLAEMDRKGALAVADPARSARLFFCLLRGDAWLRRLLDIPVHDLGREMKDQVRQAVDTFLAAHAPAGRSR